MKNRTLLAGLLIVSVLLLNACKSSLFDVTETFYIEKNIQVVGNNPDFTGQQLLDAVAESDMIDKYAAHIKSIEIQQITYCVTYCNGPSTQQINNGTLEIADENGLGLYTISAVNNVNLMAANSECAMMFDQTAVDRLADLIKNDPHTAMMYLRGTVNQAPVDFTVKVKFKVKMVAQAL